MEISERNRDKEPLQKGNEVLIIQLLPVMCETQRISRRICGKFLAEVLGRAQPYTCYIHPGFCMNTVLNKLCLRHPHLKDGTAGSH